MEANVPTTTGSKRRERDETTITNADDKITIAEAEIKRLETKEEKLKGELKTELARLKDESAGYLKAWQQATDDTERQVWLLMLTSANNQIDNAGMSAKDQIDNAGKELVQARELLNKLEDQKTSLARPHRRLVVHVGGKTSTKP